MDAAAELGRNPASKHQIQPEYVCIVITYYIAIRLPILPVVSLNGFGSPFPRQPAHLHTQAESGAYLLTRFLPISAAASIYLLPWCMYSTMERVCVLGRQDLTMHIMVKVVVRT